MIVRAVKVRESFGEASELEKSPLERSVTDTPEFGSEVRAKTSREKLSGEL